MPARVPALWQADLSVTRLKLHRAVLEIWERSKRLEAQLGALNGAAPSGSGGEGDVTDEESVQARWRGGGGGDHQGEEL